MLILVKNILNYLKVSVFDSFFKEHNIVPSFLFKKRNIIFKKERIIFFTANNDGKLKRTIKPPIVQCKIKTKLKSSTEVPCRGGREPW